MKARHWAGIAAASLAICGWVASATAHDEPKSQTTTEDSPVMPETGGYGQAEAGKKTGAITQDERIFLDEAARANLAEVQLAKLGQQKATNPDVKQFAAQLARDHQKAYDQVKQLGMKLNYGVSSTVDHQSMQLQNELTKLSGAEFDRRFMTEMTDKHEKLIETFRASHEKVQNPELKSFITTMLPSLQQHLAHAQRIEDRLTGAGYGGEQGGMEGTIPDGGVQQPVDPAVPAPEGTSPDAPQPDNSQQGGDTGSDVPPDTDLR
jgi:putative membrane protein